MWRRTLAPALALAPLAVPLTGPLTGPLAQEPVTDGAGRLRAWEQHRRLEQQSPFRDLAWRAVGPSFQGGRIEAVAVHRDQPATLYVGVGAGGVWRSENGGLTWRTIFAKESTFAVGHVAIAPSDPSIVWVGTGEAHLSGSSYAGTGVFKSTDGGESWRNVGLHDSQHIGKVVIDPVDPDVVFVAAIGPRRGPGEQRGVFKTTDGGARWERTLFVGPEVGVIDLVMDPSDRETLYAAAWDRGGGGQSGVFKTTDGGASWERLAGGLPAGEDVGRVALDVAPSDPSVVYTLLVDHSRPGRGRGGVGGVLLRSDDGGESWERTHEGYLDTYVGWDFCDVRVSPDDPDEVYVCGLLLLRSRDGGRSFERGGETVFRLHEHRGKGMHLDMHELWIDPLHPDHLLLGNDGGLYVSWDRGETWLHLNNLPIAEFYCVSFDLAEPFNIYGGTQDNASLYGPHTAALEDGVREPWRHVFLDRWAGGDGFSTFVDPSQPGVVYYEHQNGDMRRKRLDGPILSGASTERHITPRAGEGEPRLRFAWHAPLMPSHHDPRTLYCAAQRVFKSTDRGEQWTALGGDLTGGEGILCLSESSLEAGKLVAGSGRGSVHVTRDDGGEWVPVGEGLPERRMRDVLASQHDPETLYVAQSGAGQGDFAAYLHRSDDFGASWTSISAGLPEPVSSIAEDPADGRILYVGTDLGVYASLDRGASWVSLCAGLPSAPVVDVAVHPRDPVLVAATHGLSVFVMGVEAVRSATDEDQ